MENNALKELESRIAEAGSQKAYADELGISASYLNDILQGKRAITPSLLGKLGYVRVSVDVPTKQAPDVIKAIESTLDAHWVGKKPAKNRSAALQTA